MEQPKEREEKPKTINELREESGLPRIDGGDIPAKTINELRKEYGLSRIDGGDVILTKV
nr:MAG TPA: portal protein [Caudoviricetes sp.]